MNLRERYGGTALLLASKNGHDKCVDILVRAGADIDTCDTKNQSPFFGNKKTLNNLNTAGVLSLFYGCSHLPIEN